MVTTIEDKGRKQTDQNSGAKTCPVLYIIILSYHMSGAVGPEKDDEDGRGGEDYFEPVSCDLQRL